MSRKKLPILRDVIRHEAQQYPCYEHRDHRSCERATQGGVSWVRPIPPDKEQTENIEDREGKKRCVSAIIEGMQK